MNNYEKHTTFREMELSCCISDMSRLNSVLYIRNKNQKTLSKEVDMSVGTMAEKACVTGKAIAIVKVVGVAGFGVNAINHMVKNGLSDLSLVKFLTVDTAKYADS